MMAHCNSNHVNLCEFYILLMALLKQVWTSNFLNCLEISITFRHILFLCVNNTLVYFLAQLTVLMSQACLINLFCG